MKISLNKIGIIFCVLVQAFVFQHIILLGILSDEVPNFWGIVNNFYWTSTAILLFILATIFQFLLIGNYSTNKI